jgi:type IV secretory pathway VirB3-like protein
MHDYLTAPVYKSIIKPKLLFGVPRNFFILLATVTTAMVLSLSQYWFILISFGIVAVFNPIAKQEPYFFDMLTGLLRLPNGDVD